MAKTLNEIRTTFLDYFEKNDHRIVESSKRKDLAAIPIEDFIPKIAKYGFKGISLRASAVSVNSTTDKIKIIKSLNKLKS